VSEADALLKTAPEDPFFLELKGQILLESGKPKDAIPVLRESVRQAPDQPMIAVMLGHALIASEDDKNFAEAKQVLKTAVNRDNDNPFAWLQLGMIYDHDGDQARAALATAERNNLEGNPKLALASARTAMMGIPANTPDYLRAQDIYMVSETALKKDKKGKGKSRCWRPIGRRWKRPSPHPGRARRNRRSPSPISTIMPAAIAGAAIPTSSACSRRIRACASSIMNSRSSGRTALPPPAPR